MPGKKASFSEVENAALKGALRRERAQRKLSQAEMGKLLGIEQQNVAEKERPSGGGFNRGTANALAKLMGFAGADDLIIAELAANEVPVAWGTRDRATVMGPLLGYPQPAIDATLARYTESQYRQRPLRWWFDRFYDAEIDLSGPPPVSTSLPDAESAEQPRRRRRA